MQDSFEYQGSELELFAEAHRWKAYLRSELARHVRGDVLEVGAGIGAMTRVLRGETRGSWTSLEPDPALASALEATVAKLPDAARTTVKVGFLKDLPAEQRFDTILYLDVLEHIEHDRAEAIAASERLRPGGNLVILVPAHQWLFTPFDAAIGHHRRYSRATLLSALPPALTLERMDYLDSVGMLASMANRFVLRSARPTRKQIATWDTLMVPASRTLDSLIGNRLGKSLLAVSRRAST